MTGRLHRADPGGRVVRIIDFTPEDMEAVLACLDGIDRNVPVSVEPAAALLLPHTVYRVANLLALSGRPSNSGSSWNAGSLTSR
jgi:hypothetical protein